MPQAYLGEDTGRTLALIPPLVRYRVGSGRHEISYCTDVNDKRSPPQRAADIALAALRPSARSGTLALLFVADLRAFSLLKASNQSLSTGQFIGKVKKANGEKGPQYKIQTQIAIVLINTSIWLDNAESPLI